MGGRREPFSHVHVRVQDPNASVEFYTRVLGMVEQIKPKGVPPGSRTVGYNSTTEGTFTVPLVLEASPNGASVRVEQWEGRHAVTLPAKILRSVYSHIKQDYPSLIVHELRELNEQLGVLLIAIVRDHDGLEICLVSAEVFDPAVRNAADFIEPDWELRRARAAERQKPHWARSDL